MIEKAIYELIKNVNSQRVYTLRAPQNATAPFIVMQTVDSDRWRDVNGPSGMAQSTIQIDVYASQYYTAKQNADAVEVILDGYRGIVYYGSSSPQSSIRVAGISLETQNETLDQTEEPFLYRVTTRYLVTFEQ